MDPQPDNGTAMKDSKGHEVRAASPATESIEGGGAAAAATGLRSVPAVEGHNVMGLSADVMEHFLRCQEPQLVGATRARLERELLGLRHDAPPPSAAQLAPHDARLRSLTLADAIGLGPRKIWHFLRPFMIFYDIPDIALLEKPMICVWPLNLSSKRSRCGRPDPPKPLIEHCGFLQQIQTSLVTEKRQSNNW